MTDWLPWGFVVMTGTFLTIGLALRSLSHTPMGTTPDLRAARVALVVTTVLSFAVYVLYIVFGEDWIWYL